jgi:heterodisulfide reductase subunit A-like polyferredoxin
MNAHSLRHEQTLVLGDGLTGLLAAKALARFSRQTVVIKQLPAASPPYPLNGRDQAALDELFPGLLAELVRDGAIQFNLGLRVACW